MRVLRWRQSRENEHQQLDPENNIQSRNNVQSQKGVNAYLNQTV